MDGAGEQAKRMGRYLILRDTRVVKRLPVNVKGDINLVFFEFEVYIIQPCPDFDEKINTKRTLRFAPQHFGRVWKLVCRVDSSEET
jgi:hypothetical protein